MSVKEKIWAFKQSLLIDMLAQCTKPQQEQFKRIYGDLINIKEDKIDWALQLCERTINSNNNK